MPSVLIVGAGLSGATVGRCLAEQGWSVRIVEKRDHIAGNCYDYKNEAGILMNKYGAHIFHTNDARVWEFVNRFAEWIPWKHKVLGRLGDKLFPIPVNIDTVNLLLGESIETEEQMVDWLNKHTVKQPIRNSEDVAISRVGPELYDLIFRNYTWKQWERTPAELEPSVLERIPVRTNNDPYYFSDTYQVLPRNGYTHFVAAMLDHPNIKVEMNTPYTKGMETNYTILVFTGPIDQFYEGPKLEYRSLRFEEETLNIEFHQENSVVNYPGADVPYTRIIEYKHFLNQTAPGKTTIVREYSSAEGEPYYPIPTQTNREVYASYKRRADEDEATGKIYFVGRLANYKYYNMDQAILSALQISDRILTTHNRK